MSFAPDGDASSSGKVRRSRRKLSIVSSGDDLAELNLDGVSSEHQAVEPDKATTLGGGSGGDSADARSRVFRTVAGVSLTGFAPFNPHKVNQDRILAVERLDGSDEHALFAAFDGHGINGEFVSEFLTNNLAQALLDTHRLQSATPAAFKEACRTLKAQLQRSPISCAFAGSTAVMAYVTESHIHVANVGDSRCVLVRKAAKGGSEVLALSRDHKPDLSKERQRIERLGGRVEACKGPRGEDLGPMRVWLKEQDIPGLAMSRSFGDDVAGQVGVISDPEVVSYVRTGREQAMVLGSDGVFEFMANEKVAEHVLARLPSPKRCAELICAEATKLWKKHEDVIDDISAVVVTFGGD